jgi:hypothetical protein
MRFKVTVYAAAGDKAVEGEVVNFDEMEQMGTVYVPGATQAEAEELAFACVGGGPGWHPVYQTNQIPHLLVVDKFDIAGRPSVRFFYDYSVEKPVVVDRLEVVGWVPASDEDIEKLRATYGGIVCHPEKYQGTFETMNRDELPDWVKTRLAA